MGLDRLWAGWRSQYVASVAGEGGVGECFLCRLAPPASPGDDADALVLERTELTLTVMNLYPYCSGHVLVAPRRHQADLEALTPQEAIALTEAQVRAVRALKAAFAPEGVNLGANLGRAAGAGLPGHLHVHALPRWSADTNFMTAVAEVRVLPEDLRTSYAKLRAAWPTGGSVGSGA